LFSTGTFVGYLADSPVSREEGGGLQHWALSTLQPFGEKLAIENLSRQEFDTYSPQFMDRKIVRGKVSWSSAPLFPGYLFVFVDRLQDRWRSIIGTKGIASLFTMGDDPVQIRSSHIDQIKALEVDGHVVLPQLPKFIHPSKFKDGDEVIPSKGFMANKVVIYAGQRRGDRVKVLFSMLGAERETYIRESDLTAA
jgi:transcriptional antiterminator RfaH